jgi:hypothetical protein
MQTITTELERGNPYPRDLETRGQGCRRFEINEPLRHRAIIRARRRRRGFGGALPNLKLEM